MIMRFCYMNATVGYEDAEKEFRNLYNVFYSANKKE